MLKIEKLFKYVSEHNNFYKNIINEYGITDFTNITQYPVITRSQLQDNRYSMFSDGYKSKYFSQQLLRQSSSGSSGVPVNVYWDYNDWYISNMALWRMRYKWYGISPKDKCIKFTLSALNHNNNGDIVHYINPENVLSINMSLIQDDRGWEKIVNLINDFNPDWLQIQPCVLNKLVQIYENISASIPSNLKYIESIGELLFSDIRKKTENLYKIPVANMYGSEEMNGIAIECPYHQMHIIEDNVFVEVKSEGGIVAHGEGEAILTNLNNKAMPLIRYNQGDIIVIDKNLSFCSCGCKSPIVKIIFGRSNEHIVLSNNIVINPFMLSEIIMEVNNMFKDIIKMYKYIFDPSCNTLDCYLSIPERDAAWFENIKKEIVRVFGQKTHGDSFLSFRVFKFDKGTSYIKKYRVLEIVGGRK